MQVGLQAGQGLLPSAIRDASCVYGGDGVWWGRNWASFGADCIMYVLSWETQYRVNVVVGVLWVIMKPQGTSWAHRLHGTSWLAMSKGDGRPLEGIQLEGDIVDLCFNKMIHHRGLCIRFWDFISLCINKVRASLMT